MLVATATREGEPVAYVFGPVPESGGGAITAGLLMLRAGTAEAALTFTDPATGETLRLALPPDGLNLKTDAYALNQRMELMNP